MHGVKVAAWRLPSYRLNDVVASANVPVYWLLLANWFSPKPSLFGARFNHPFL
jgi:hypothetical protein